MPSGRKRGRKKGKSKAKGKRRSPYPRVLRSVKWQRGRSNTAKDRRLKAMKPGKRVSRTRRIYWETRKNRSDLKAQV